MTPGCCGGTLTLIQARLAGTLHFSGYDDQYMNNGHSQQDVLTGTKCIELVDHGC